MTRPIRAAIVDDHTGVRVEIRNLLTRGKDIIVVGEGANGEEALQLAQQVKPDVLVLDVELPVMRGDEVIQKLRKENSKVLVLALSSYDDPMYILSMLENGADGYITKDEAYEKLPGAIRSIVYDRVKWISPRVAEKISRIELENLSFTGRELEILRLMVLGRRNLEITAALGISDDLLERDIDLLEKKFRVSTRESLKSAAHKVISADHN